MTTDVNDLVDCDLVVEAIVEDPDAKREYLAELGRPPRTPTSRPRHRR